MKLVIQRVSSSSIVVNDKIIAKSEIPGLLVLVGFGKEDTEAQLTQALNKIGTIRIFSNQDGRFDQSLMDIAGDLTLVPQFTLYADTSKGRRPEFFSALEPKEAARLFDILVLKSIELLGAEKVHSGEFGADMKVRLTNDGPVTITMEII